MSPFTFPDPSVQSSIVNPTTGDLWIFEDGVWMLADPNDPDGAIDPGTPLTGDDLIDQLRAEIQTLRNDIIELQTQLTAASLNNFLILE